MVGFVKDILIQVSVCERRVENDPVAVVAIDTDHSQAFEIIPRQTTLSRKWMITKGRQNICIFEKRREKNVGMRGAQNIYAKLRFAASYAFEPVDRGHVQYADANASGGTVDAIQNVR